MYLNPVTANLVARTEFPVAAAAKSADASGDSAGQITDPNTMFLQLLTTQLQNQTPLDPVDPNQFTTELVQFNMLDELTQIRQLLQQVTTAPATSGNTNTSTQGVQ